MWDFTAADFGRWSLVKADYLGLTKFLVQFISELCILSKCAVSQGSFTKGRQYLVDTMQGVIYKLLNC